MKREFFLHIVNLVTQFDPWFVHKIDVLDRLGLSTLQKCTTAIRILAYSMAADACNEYCRLKESTVQEYMKKFVVAIRGCFQSTYLRQSTKNDLEQHIAINKERRFPGMFGSLDCMH